MPIRHLHPQHAQQGISLLEVLVSIVVLSFGVLGAVGLQAASLQANREARLQSTGVQFANEMAELIRSNHQVAVLTTSQANPYLVDIKSSSYSSAGISCGLPQTNSSTCNSSQASTRDIQDWLTRMQTALPGFRAVICFDSTPYDSAGLPQWSCSNSGNSLAIKIGWTRANTLSGASGADATSTSSTNTGAFDKALRPAVVIPVTPGVS